MKQEIYPGIVVDTETAHGVPILDGTRIPVATILGALAAGDSVEEVCDGYGVTREQVLATLGYATERIGGEVIYVNQSA